MARLRPFRGIRYTLAAGELSRLLAPPSSHLTPGQRDGYAARSAFNVVALASPEGHGDDRSKYIRYARAAARLAEWQREGFVAQDEHPAFYRVIQRFGKEPVTRTTLLAVADPSQEAGAVEIPERKTTEERLRLLEATRTAFEPALALFNDLGGALLRTVVNAAASSEVEGNLDGPAVVVERIDDAEQVEAIVRAFEGVPLLVADGSEGFEAAKSFPGGHGAFVALASLNGPGYVRIPVHRVVRRLPQGKAAVLATLAQRFEIEEHHNRNLSLHLERFTAEGRIAFGMATEGGQGYLLTPKTTVEGSAVRWFVEEILGSTLGITESDPALAFTDALQAIRATEEGAGAAFLFPAPAHDEIVRAYEEGRPLPAHSAQTYPVIPSGLAFWTAGESI